MAVADLDGLLEPELLLLREPEDRLDEPLEPEEEEEEAGMVVAAQIAAVGWRVCDLPVPL